MTPSQPWSKCAAGALVIGNDPIFNSRGERLAALTTRHAVPAIFQFREFTAAGGLMSYGASITDLYRLGGVYTGRLCRWPRQFPACCRGSA
jgi:putative ABC transport system substrate-binding protein